MGIYTTRIYGLIGFMVFICIWLDILLGLIGFIRVWLDILLGLGFI
jgi:hypothetical protein